jgi:hypothetical protein
VDIPPDERKLAERLFTRIQKLELTVKRLEQKVAGPAAAATARPAGVHGTGDGEGGGGR